MDSTDMPENEMEAEKSSDDEYFLNSMEDFIDFVWGKKSHYRPKSFSESLKYSTEESFVWKSFKNKFENDNLLDQNTIREIKNGRLSIDNLVVEESSENPQLYPDLINHNFLPFKSSLNKKDMIKCFEIYLDICAHKKLTAEQFEIFSKFKDTIEKEQQTYLQTAKDFWEKNKIYERVNHVLPEVIAYTTKLWKERLEKIHWYPKMYKRITDIPLIDTSGRADDSEFEYIGNLKVIGNSPWINFPQKRFGSLNIYSKLTEISFENDSLKKVEDSYKPVHPTFLQKGYHPEVSKDKIAESLASRKNADVVMSESAFMRLFDIHKEVFTASWVLPVVIKQLDDASNHKVVFIDKALPPKELTAAQRNKWFCKKLMPDILENDRLNEWRKTSKKTRRGSCDKNVDDDSDIELETFGKMPDYMKVINGECFFGQNSNIGPVKLEDLETFPQPGCSNENEMPGDEEKQKEDEESDCCSENELIIDEQIEKENPSPKNYSKKLPKVSLKTTKQNKKNVSIQYQPVKTDYNLWKFKADQSSVLLKNKLQEINIIIRCKSTSKVKLGGKTQNQIISSKLEYQPSFGAEELSHSEITQEWCRIFLRPESQLLRVRVDPLGGSVIMAENKCINGLTTDVKRLYSFNPQERLKHIHSILDQLVKQPPGVYMFKRSINNELFAELSKADERHGTEIMSLDYINIDFDKIALSHHGYLKIDNMVITPLFFNTKRIPATFYPKMTKLKSMLSNLAVGEDESQKQPRPKKKKNTKKKNMKKKQKLKKNELS